MAAFHADFCYHFGRDLRVSVAYRCIELGQAREDLAAFQVGIFKARKLFVRGFPGAAG